MSFIFTIFQSFISDLIDKLNKIIENHERKVNLNKIVITKTCYSIIFIVTFLLGNATSMKAIIYRDILGPLGLIFPVSSCTVLYSISVIALKNILFYSNEHKYYKRELEEKLSKEETQKK